MGKKTSKKCDGTIIDGTLLATVGTVTVGANTTNFRNNQNMKLKQEIGSQLIEEQKDERFNQTFKYNDLSADILNIVNDLKEKGANQEEIRTKIQYILQDSMIRAIIERQSSKSLRDFYGIDIFSCRGFV
jgi:hypothetical protein